MQILQISNFGRTDAIQKEGNMDIKIGDLVTFKKGLYPDEEGAVYRILEINGDRSILELANTNMIIRPQSVAILSELDLFVGIVEPLINHTK